VQHASFESRWRSGSSRIARPLTHHQLSSDAQLSHALGFQELDLTGVE
jgi:hypothetical protein